MARDYSTMDTDELIARRRTHGIEKKAAEAELGLIDSFLMPRVLTDPKAEATESGNIALKHSLGTVSVQTRTTKTINRVKLIASGVDADVVDACTDENESNPFVVFYPKKDPA